MSVSQSIGRTHESTSLAASFASSCRTINPIWSFLDTTASEILSAAGVDLIFQFSSSEHSTVIALGPPDDRADAP